MPDLVCAGHVNWDVTLQVDSLPPPDGEALLEHHVQAGGGSASNTAVVLADLNYEPALLGSVGTDESGKLVQRELHRHGVDCTSLQTVSGETTVKYLVVDGDGQVMVLSNEGVNEEFVADDLPETVLQGVSHLHLTSQRPKTAHRLLERAREVDISVSFDPGRRLGERGFHAVIEGSDVVFLNIRETNTAIEEGYLQFSENTETPPVVVEKRGDDGARLHTESETISHPGFDAEPVDTAGAGDAFAAGFLAAWLSEMSYERALAVGNACGTVAVQSPGARTTLSWEVISEYVDVER